MKLKYAQKGIATVELAIVVPVLLIILLAICELGIVLYDQAIITNASREAARAGIVLRNPKLTTEQIQAVATTYCQSFLVSFSANAGTAPFVDVDQSSPPDFGTPLTVTVSYNYNNFLLGYLLSMFTVGTFPNPLPLSATTTMNNE